MSPEPATKLILCMKWGSKYGPEYVNRLQRMVARHITPPFQLVCLTDDSRGIDPAVRTLPLPELGCPEPERTRGKWRKVARGVLGLTIWRAPRCSWTSIR